MTTHRGAGHSIGGRKPKPPMNTEPLSVEEERDPPDYGREAPEWMRLATAALAEHPRPAEPDQWTALANDIRIVDGNHDLGAGELAQRLVERGWGRPAEPERPDHGHEQEVCEACWKAGHDVADAPCTEAPDLRADLYATLAGALAEAAEAEARAHLDRKPGEPMSGSWGERIYAALTRNGVTVALAPTTGHGLSATPAPERLDVAEPDPIETFSHPYRAPVVIDGHEYRHTSDCDWPARESGS